MAKAENKTVETEASVDDFLKTIDDDKVRLDCLRISDLMTKATGEKPKMWGANIVGFGNMKLKYDSGRELDWLEIGFSPRKANISLYGIGLDENLLVKLGKHKTGKGCLYVKSLSDVNEDVLVEMIQNAITKKRSE